MFVTNLTNKRHGIDGIIILGPKEENRWVPDTPDYIERVGILKGLNMVSVSEEEGLIKPEPLDLPTEQAELGTEKTEDIQEEVEATDLDANDDKPSGTDAPKQRTETKGRVKNGRNTRSSKDSE